MTLSIGLPADYHWRPASGLNTYSLSETRNPGSPRDRFEVRPQVGGTSGSAAQAHHPIEIAASEITKTWWACARDASWSPPYETLPAAGAAAGSAGAAAGFGLRRMYSDRASTFSGAPLSNVRGADVG